MKTKYFSNVGEETLEDLKVNVDKWIATRKNIQIIEMKTSTPSKANPTEFFIRLSYDDKPPRLSNPNSIAVGAAAPATKRRS